MSRRKPESRCSLCRMKKELCLCSDIEALREQVTCRTRLELIIHHREEKLSTNTGRLACLALENSKMHLYGHPEVPFLPKELIDRDRYCPVVLALSEDSQELDQQYLEKIDRPVQLIVPDGNWRQASKIPTRVEEFRSLPKVRISGCPQTEYRLRHEPKVGGLATMEAIASAYGILEGPDVEKALRGLFRKMVSRTLESRGTAV